ncbi:MAG TPA: response regulator transcription factor, partial [Anaerolineae bacterium]|nr:response regulator transcription factor [Anaerolineae bacterium]
VIRNGLRYSLLAFDDIAVVGEAGSGEEALSVCGRTQPDVVLMDLLMPGMNGEVTTQAIKARHPEIQVIALTSFQHKGMMQKVMQAGAIGFLLKNVSIDELAEAIRTAYAGRLTLASEAAQMLLEPTEELGTTLTERQREVLDLVVEGLSNNEIAERLVVSLSTARHHVSEILTKLGAANRAEAAAIAVRQNLV